MCWSQKKLQQNHRFDRSLTFPCPVELIRFKRDMNCLQENNLVCTLWIMPHHAMFVSLSHEINEKWQLVLLFCPVVLPVGSSLVKSIVWHHHAPFRHKTKHVTHTKTCFKNVFHCTTVKPIHTWSIEVPFNQPCACIMSFWKPLNVEISWNDFAVVSWLFWSFISFELSTLYVLIAADN